MCIQSIQRLLLQPFPPIIINNQHCPPTTPYIHPYPTMDMTPTQKSYNTSKTIRRLHRLQILQQNRFQTSSSYLSTYPLQIQQKIKLSLQSPLPQIDVASVCPVLGEVNKFNISYYRRIEKPVWKIREDGCHQVDLHMLYESLWGLAGIQQLQKYSEYQNPHKIQSQFTQLLPSILTLPHKQIKQLAIISAGNKILGKAQDILHIANQDNNQLWVLINHIYERKIPLNVLYRYLDSNQLIVYRTIYEMSNNQKDQIIQGLVQEEEVVEKIMGGMEGKNGGGSGMGGGSGIGVEERLDIAGYCVKIVGNVLAQKQDYTHIFIQYKLLDHIIAALRQSQPRSTDQQPIKKKRSQLKKDILWLLSNYISDTAPATDILHKPALLQKLLLMHKKSLPLPQKIQLYRILSGLAYYGEQLRIYQIAVQEKLLEQCIIDIEIENQQLTLYILNLVNKLVEIGEEYAEEEGDDGEEMGGKGRNRFIVEICNSKMRAYVNAKTFNKNKEISDVSFQIMGKIQEFEERFGEDAM